MNRNRRLTGLLVLGSTFGLAACSASPSAAVDTPRTSASPSAAAVAASKADGQIWIDHEIRTSVDVSAASPAQFTDEPQALRPEAAEGRVVTFSGVTADGRFLATESSSNPLRGGDATLDSFSSVGLWEAGDGFTTVARTGREAKGRLAGAHRQVVALTHAGDRLVWLETPSTDVATQDWSLHTALADGSGARELAHSRALDGSGGPDGARSTIDGTHPVVIGDWVYWTAGSADEGWGFDLLRTKLSGGAEPQTVARNAVAPAVSGADLIYATFDEAAPDVYEIHRRPAMGEGADETLIRGRRSGRMDLTALAASDSVIAWAVRSPDQGKSGEPGRVFALDRASDEVTGVATIDSPAPTQLALTRSGVLWSAGDRDPTEYHLNTATRQISSFAKNPGFSVVQGHPDHNTVMWAEGSNPQTHRAQWYAAELDLPD